jgi:rhamnosyltransferase
MIKAAFGRQLPNSTCREIEKYTRSFNYPEESRVKSKADLETLGIKTFFCSNVCAMYEKKTYDSLGGFARRTIFNEDMIFAAKLIQNGYGVAYAADARVIHSHNYTGFQQFTRNFDLAVSQKDHPEVFEGIRSEGEGIRLVKQTAAYLTKSGKIHLVPQLVYMSGCKYLGYLIGKRYQKLPRFVILRCTMNKNYWKG